MQQFGSGALRPERKHNIKFVAAKRSRTQAVVDIPDKYLFIRVKPKSPNHAASSTNGVVDYDEGGGFAEEDEDAGIEVFSKELVERSNAWLGVKGIGPGILNVGNSCYVNSVLQCMLYTPALTQLAVNGDLRGEEDTATGALVSLALTASQHDRSARFSISADWFVSNLYRISSDLKPGFQHDSHEFLRCLLEAIQKESLQSNGINPHEHSVRTRSTFVHQLFGGTIESEIQCMNAKCLGVSTTFDPFLDLSLELTRANAVSSALSQFLAEEKLDSNNKWLCPHCDTRVEAVKRLKLSALPNVLALHLKRFGPYSTKIRSHIRFETFIKLEDASFSLYAVLVHSGRSARSGHYVSYVKAANSLWYEMDDSKVKQVSLSKVLSQNAYLLFYTKKNEFSPPRHHYLQTLWTRQATSTRKYISQLFLHVLRSRPSVGFHVQKSQNLRIFDTENATKRETSSKDEVVRVIPRRKRKKGVDPEKWKSFLVAHKVSQSRGDNKRKHRYDEWDRALDEGRVKKVKLKVTQPQTNANLFQEMANRKRKHKEAGGKRESPE